MNRQEAIDYLAKFLKPDLLALIVQALPNGPARTNGLQEPMQADIQVYANGLQDNDKEPFLENCPHCAAHGIKAAHLLGTIPFCPYNTHRPEWVKKYLAELEAEQEYEDSRKYMEHYYEGGE